MLKDLRKKVGLTQVELARKLDVSQSSVATWEAKRAMPRADAMEKLAEILGCSVEIIFRSIKNS